MIIFSFQPQCLTEQISKQGFVTVDIEKTNFMKQNQRITTDYITDINLWMARKLSEKTGIWMPGKNENKLPVLPFWGWYLTDGKNQKPDPDFYYIGSGIGRNMDDVMLYTLDIPEKYVLLSDINAWYCVMEGRPCYEYEPENVERAKIREFEKKKSAVYRMPEYTAAEKEAKSIAADNLWNEMEQSWDNIFRLTGRRLKYVMGMKERYDIQAVFPFILKKWVVNVEAI